MSDCICGVCCTITDCKFHQGDCGCSAGEINVGGHSPYTAVVGDCAHVATCATYQPKNV